MRKFGILYAFISIIFVSCGPSTKLVKSWVNQDETQNKYEKLAVVAFTPNNSNRFLIERAIVANFMDDGIKAIPTHKIFPMAGRMGGLGDLDKDPEGLKKMVKKKVTDNNIDALMVISVFDIQKEQRYVNDRNYVMAGTGYYGNPYMRGAYYNYYSYSIGTVYDPGYYVEDITYFLECNLFDVASETLLWTGRTKTVRMESVQEEVIYFSEIVIKEILKKKVIVP